MAQRKISVLLRFLTGVGGCCLGCGGAAQSESLSALAREPTPVRARVLPNAAPSASSSSATVEGNGVSRTASAPRGTPVTQDFNHWPRLPAAQFSLAVRYANGDGVEKDANQAAIWAGGAVREQDQPALDWLGKRAEAGDPYACLYLGRQLASGPSALRDPTRAAALYQRALPALERAAEAGEAQAEYSLFIAHSMGCGVPEDAPRARAWLERSAGRGYLPALTDLGWANLTGKGGAKNEGRALELTTLAAERGHALAQRNLGFWSYSGTGKAPKDQARSLQWFLAAARQGDAGSQYMAGLMLGAGLGTDRDPAQAVAWLEKAAAQGDSAAQGHLALKLEDGDGVAVDLKRAVELYRTAALAGDNEAQTNLARAYRDGIGVAPDLGEARKWYGKAADHGYEPAKRQLAQLKRRSECLSTAQTKLFDVVLKCATRVELRRAAAQLGAKATREEDKYWFDLYDSSKLLDESSELSLAFTHASGDFARATYTFPSDLDAEQVTRVAELVASKYGRPQQSQGNASLGPVRYEWRLKDGVVISVHRGWPDTTTYQDYTVPANYAAVEREIAKSDAAQKAEDQQRQSHAF